MRPNRPRVTSEAGSRHSQPWIVRRVRNDYILTTSNPISGDQHDHFDPLTLSSSSTLLKALARGYCQRTTENREVTGSTPVGATGHSRGFYSGVAFIFQGSAPRNAASPPLRGQSRGDLEICVEHRLDRPSSLSRVGLGVQVSLRHLEG